MPRTLTCADCGNVMAAGRGSLPQGQAACRACRQVRPKPYGSRPGSGRTLREFTCVGCGCAFKRVARPDAKYCTIQCANVDKGKKQRIRSDDDSRVRRHQREVVAPGLTRRERDALLATWRKQGKSCAYCTRPADTVDHVVPLVRGGTNYEGNLVPCCRSCNGAKAGWLVIEWRTGKRLTQLAESLRWKRQQRRTVKAKPQVIVQEVLRICPICEALHDRPGAIYCSRRCCSTANERRKTERARKPVRTACPRGHAYDVPGNRRVRVRVRDGAERIETECAACQRSPAVAA